jgi:hypothetical protein
VGRDCWALATACELLPACSLPPTLCVKILDAKLLMPLGRESEPILYEDESLRWVMFSDSDTGLDLK